MAGADAEVADVLFATLDPLVRQVRTLDGLTHSDALGEESRAATCGR
ncbi:hypothetical protein [Streptomyces sp. DH-12]